MHHDSVASNEEPVNTGSLPDLNVLYRACQQLYALPEFTPEQKTRLKDELCEEFNLDPGLSLADIEARALAAASATPRNPFCFPSPSSLPSFAALVTSELAAARRRYPPIKALQEGLEELEDEVEDFTAEAGKTPPYQDKVAVLIELVHIGAVVQRIAEDLNLCAPALVEDAFCVSAAEVEETDEEAAVRHIEAALDKMGQDTGANTEALARKVREGAYRKREG